jgi:hypothetical protein
MVEVREVADELTAAAVRMIVDAGAASDPMARARLVVSAVFSLLADA